MTYYILSNHSFQVEFYHGGRFLVVLRDGRYMGLLTGFDGFVPKVARNSVVLVSDGTNGGSKRSWPLHFTEAGPPRRSLVDGELVNFDQSP
jgi:hypothetical protein